MFSAYDSKYVNAFDLMSDKKEIRPCALASQDLVPIQYKRIANIMQYEAFSLQNQISCDAYWNELESSGWECDWNFESCWSNWDSSLDGQYVDRYSDSWAETCGQEYTPEVYAGATNVASVAAATTLVFAVLAY